MTTAHGEGGRSGTTASPAVRPRHAHPGSATAVATRRANDLRDQLPAVGAGAAALFLLLAFFSTDDGPVLCPFRRCTGGYCPGCGMTRSGGHLLRGDLASSWAQHPFIVLAAAQLAVAGTIVVLGGAALRSRIRRWYHPIMLANAGLIFTIWVVRLVDGTIPVPFAG